MWIIFVEDDGIQLTSKSELCQLICEAPCQNVKLLELTFIRHPRCQKHERELITIMQGEEA